MSKTEKKADAIVKEDAKVMTTQDAGVIPNVDEKINAFGIDVPQVSKPETGSKLKPLSKAPMEAKAVDPIAQLRGAVVYLVKSLMTPADVEDFKKLFPGLI